MTTAYLQALTQYQAGSGNIIGATSVVLVSLNDIYGNAITTMTPFGTTGYITLEPDTSNEEAAIFTGITVNANGTVSLTGVSTVLAQTPYTSISGLVRQHSGGTKVVITDNVAFWATFANKNNNETIVGKYTFPSANRPALSADVDTAVTTEFPTFGQLSRVVVSGAPNASTSVKGIVQEATQAQVLSKTAAGSTGAELYVNPSTVASTLLSDYKADTGAVNAYAIAPSPAITSYVVGQIFSFKAANANTTASTLNVNGLGAKTIKKVAGTTDLASGDIATGMLVLVEYDGTNFIMLNPVGNTPATFKFGGTGADGALSSSSGTTTIDFGGARILVKNYTSVSLTGTVALAFINPHSEGSVFHMRSQGAVTITTSGLIDLRLMGGDIGNGVGAGGASSYFSGNSAAGGAGGTGASSDVIGTKGVEGGNAAAGAVGSFSTSATPAPAVPALSSSILRVSAGSGGGTPSAPGGTPGAGGRGGGGLLIECAGTYTFTTGTINTSGANGTAGSGSPGVNTGGAGGGGGGSAGQIMVVAGVLGTDSGTYTQTGGSGGGGGSAGGSSGLTPQAGQGGGAGGAALNLRSVNTFF